MRRKFAFFLLLFFLGGCATFQETGSNYWHKNRLKEIEAAYQNEEITEAEYLSLKNEADKIREEHIRQGHAYYEYYGYYPSAHYGYYYPPYYGYQYSHYYGHHHYGGYGYYH